MFVNLIKLFSLIRGVVPKFNKIVNFLSGANDC